MVMRIVILEDDAGRRAAMRECLEGAFPQIETRFFDEAAAMTEFLDNHLEETIAISLDHDLELRPGDGGGMTDPGTGRDVADHLARRPPACRVVIHSTNTTAAVGMETALRDAGWRTGRVSPYGDLEWVAERWLPCILRAILKTTKQTKQGRDR
jgi:DNA-binding NarL/FixJ family response regulator